MRKILGGALVAALVLAAPRANALEVLIGTITATATLGDGGTGAVTNSTTAVPFTVPKSSRLAIQCDGTAYVYFSKAGTLASSTNGVKVSADDLYDTSSGLQLAVISVVAASGTVNCKVFQVY